MSLLSAYKKRHPETSAEDAAALFFENTFGRSPFPQRITPQALRAERTGGKPQETEDIGNGFLRVYLSPDRTDEEISALRKACERTAAFRKGTRSEYLKKCAELPKIFGTEGEKAFRKAIETNLSQTQKDSELLPTRYCVVDRSVYRYREILDFLEPHAGRDRLSVAIDGKCASGKTTLSRFLQKYFSAALLHTDDFYLPAEQRDLSAIGGNIDFIRLKRVIQAWKKGESASYSPFDCKNQRYGRNKILPNRKMLLTEGVYSFHPNLKGCFDLHIYLNISQGSRVQRIRAREKENAKKFLAVWAVREDIYFQTFPPEIAADFIFNADKAE